MKIVGLAVAAVLSLAAFSAHASTVASFGTGSSGSVTGGTLTPSVSVSDTNHSAYFQGATTPASNWVWATSLGPNDSMTYTFEFDLTGYNLNTASLSGYWGIDNIGTVLLNGNILSELPNVVTGNFNVLTAYTASVASYFNQGINELVFQVANQGGPGAFRASGVVTAAVPLPATLPLLLGAFGFLGVALRRRASA